MQQKDVIYIDVEDDITAIIGKVKAAKEKIVALVPPKRPGVLQSAVNLRLLERAAESSNKHLVLITSNTALGGLAASAKIPVAKTLQSRPELAAIPVLGTDDDDVIDGEQLPVGDHAGIKDEPAEGAVPASSINGLNIDGESAPLAAKSATKSPRSKPGIKVPNFGSFRKKAVLIAGGGVLLVLFLIWAIAIAPHATVVVSAKTSPQALTTPVTLGTDLTTSSDQALIKSVEMQNKVSQSIDFDATGTANKGDKATGQVKMTALAPSDISIPAGTVLSTDGGLSFTTNTGAIIPRASTAFPACFPTACPSSATVTVTAAEAGAKYNGATGSLSGAPTGVTSQFTNPASGGTDKNVKIVLQADVEKAKALLADQNKDEEKKKLVAKFGKDDKVIDSSFTLGGGDPSSAPAIGQEAPSGKAKLTREMTYKMTGIAKSELDTYLAAAFKKTLTNNTQQRVYDNGASSVKFEDFKDGDRTDTASINATAQIGPKIDDEAIKQQVKGKRVGEVMGDLKAIDGISDVNVKLSPFWVAGVPDDIKKITIEFKLIK